MCRDLRPVLSRFEPHVGNANGEGFFTMSKFSIRTRALLSMPLALTLVVAVTSAVALPSAAQADVGKSVGTALARALLGPLVAADGDESPRPFLGTAPAPQGKVGGQMPGKGGPPGQAWIRDLPLAERRCRSR